MIMLLRINSDADAVGPAVADEPLVPRNDHVDLKHGVRKGTKYRRLLRNSTGGSCAQEHR